MNIEEKQRKKEINKSDKRKKRSELSTEEMEIRKNKDRDMKERAKENPDLKGVACRFTVDEPYFHDIIESFEGPLKVWCKGEKLEHDSLWQTVVVERYTKRLSEAYMAF